ncbi:MAG: HlyC/CorC family transporter, partial [Pseudomonadota bacterium]
AVARPPLDQVYLGILAGLRVLLILLSGFFSGSETALMTLNRYRLRHLANEGHGGARRAKYLLERTDRLIGLILLGNNFVNILASALATAIALDIWGEPGIAIATGGMTLVVLIFAEVAPKTLATRHPERLAFFASYIYVPLLRVMYPIVYLINLMANQVLKLFGATQVQTNEDALSREELRTVLADSGKKIPKAHVDMLLNVLDLEQVTVNDVMVPRNDIVGIDLDEPWNVIVGQVVNSPHGRLLAYRENIDNAVGLLQVRKVFIPARNASLTHEGLEKQLQELYFIPENTPLNVQLLNFQREKRRSALVVDEYGDIQGLLTVEDILQEIVGEFTDDAYAAPPEIQLQDNGQYLIDGATPVRTLNRELGWDLNTDGPKTLNGVILEQLESLPDVGAELHIADCVVEVIALDGNAVETARVTPAPDTGETVAPDEIV